MAATAARVTSVARQLTAERGVSGFPVEEVCERAGISRRTFFNYFASKDDAVLGRSLHRGDDAYVAEFLARGPSGDLLDDLAWLTARRWLEADMTIARAREVHAAFQAEPRLFARFVEHTVADQQSDVDLVERREGLPRGDLRATAAVQIIGSLATSAVQAFLAEGNDTGYTELLTRRLAAGRALLSPDPERTS